MSPLKLSETSYNPIITFSRVNRKLQLEFYAIISHLYLILETLSKGVGNEYQFTDAMKELMTKESFYACKLDATYYDTGSKFGYLKANIDYALEREEFKENLEDYLKSLK